MAVVTTIAMHKSCIRGTLCQWRVCYVFYGNDVRHYVMPSASNSKQFLLSNEIINFPYHSLYVYFFLNSLQHIFNIFSCLQTSILLSNQNSIGHSLIYPPVVNRIS